jgi:hypothetical protein
MNWFLPIVLYSVRIIPSVLHPPILNVWLPQQRCGEYSTSTLPYTVKT